MAIKDVFKISFKTFINPLAWIGAKELKTYNKIIGGVLKNAFTPAKAERIEEFNQAMQRQNITEEDLKKIDRQYLINTAIFIGLAICSFLASFFYLFYHKTFSGMVLCLATTILFLSQAFRFHFWHFQIKHRKLGCTFKEWWQGTIKE